MARVLIAGCGYVGAAAADLLHAAGWEVEGWRRTASAGQLSEKGYRIRGVDLADADAVAKTTGDFEVVVHCASTRGGDAESYRQIYLQGAQNLTKRFLNAKILFCSSTSVYAQQNGELVNEESPAEPAHESGQVLRLAEEHILGQGGLVLRLAGIYGPGRSVLLRRFLRGEAVLDPENDRFVNEVHRDDVAAALSWLAAGEAAGGIYNVTDNEPILLSECYRWLARKLDRPLPPAGKMPAKRKRGASNKRVSNARLRALGWAPQFPTLREGMEKSVLPNLEKSPV